MPEFAVEQTRGHEPEAFAVLRAACGLSDFDLDVIRLALAPEIDARYERIYAFLQDDVARKRPTVDLALNLFCASAEEKLNGRSSFLADAPLVRSALVRIEKEGAASFLARTIVLDERIASFLLGSDALDERLSQYASVAAPQSAASGDGFPPGLDRLINICNAARERLLLCFHGVSPAARTAAARALAGALHAPLLVVDTARALSAIADADELFRLVVREAWLQSAILLFEHADAIAADTARSLDAALVLQGGIVVFSTDGAWRNDLDALTQVVNFRFDPPSWEARRDWWRRALAEAVLPPAEEALDRLAGSFRLDRAQIVNAAAIAHHRAQLVAANAAPGDFMEEVFGAARAQTGDALGGLARKIVPVNGWDDLGAADVLAHLREIASRALRQHQVLKRWGFDRKLSSGKGVTALFCGASGTGKTLAVEVLAHELRLDLYKIDLAGVVSKYIGETEKNLDKIFATAEGANAILFFDEADALFGKRSEVRDLHDRYANLEISYLLQKMEQFEGVAILATNLRQNLDDAFLRRLAFTVQFPFPDETSRRRIWTEIWPPRTPLAPDVDLNWLARRFMLSGGNIRNIALASAYLAAEDNSVVTMAHLIHATRREFQKMGKTLSSEEVAAAGAAAAA